MPVRTLTAEEVEELRAELAEQGLPEFVEDPVVLDNIATIHRAARLSAAAIPAPAVPATAQPAAAGAGIGAASTVRALGEVPPAPAAPSRVAVPTAPAHPQDGPPPKQHPRSKPAQSRAAATRAPRTTNSKKPPADVAASMAGGS